VGAIDHAHPAPAKFGFDAVTILEGGVEHEIPLEAFSNFSVSGTWTAARWRVL
jgi:hypothetical protein